MLHYNQSEHRDRYISQSFNGVPTASIFRLILCSMGESITHESELLKSHPDPFCCANTLKFLTLSLFCLLVTAHKVLCSFVAFANNNMLVSTVALSKIFTPAKSMSLRIGILGKEIACFLTITSTHPFIRRDIAKMPIGFE